MMSVNNLQPAALGQIIEGAADDAVSSLLTDIKSDNDDVRTAAWLRASDVGTAAVGPLAVLVAEQPMEISRAAKRGMWQIVRQSGRPGADAERAAVAAALVDLLNDSQPLELRRDVLWMLSEVGGDDCVEPVAALIASGDLREDARMTLERIPGDASLAALKSALDTVPDEFKINIAQSLRQRGVEVPGLPCQKLVPTKSTNVTPVTSEQAQQG